VSSLIRGRRVLVALGDEPPYHYLRNFDSMKSFDVKSYVEQKRLFVLDVYAEFAQAIGMQTLSNLSTLESVPAEEIADSARRSGEEQIGPDLKGFNVVTDSLTAFSPFIGIRDVHRVILAAQTLATENNHVMIYTAHEGALEGNLTQVIRQYADGVIRLRKRWVRGSLRREMVIEKMRFTEITEPVLEYRITDKGVEII
jgi:KaiC/GvpD/RAD55 family RecA-like ATPase